MSEMLEKILSNENIEKAYKSSEYQNGLHIRQRIGATITNS